MIFCSRLILLLLPVFFYGVMTSVHATPAGSSRSALTLTESEQLWLGNHPTIRVRVSRSYPPFEFYADDHYQGLAYDYLTAVGQTLGVEFQPIEGLNWSESLEGIQGGRDLDLILLITHTTERESFLNFTRDYLSFEHVIFTRKSAEQISKLSDLINKTVAVEKGYIMADWLRGDLHDAVALLEVADTEAALLAVVNGAADAYVGNLAVGSYFVDNNRLIDLKVAGRTPFGEDRLAMGVRKDWPELVRLLDKALAGISAEERRRIRQKWVAVRYDHGIDSSDIAGWVLLVTFLALVWIVQLRLVVRRRTADLRQEIDLRRKQEIELQQSMEIIRVAHQRLRIQVKRMPLAYIVWDTEFRVIEWNPAAEKMFGWKSAEAKGKHPYEFIVKAELKPVIDVIWHELLAGDEMNFSENENLTKSGATRMCAWYNTPLRDPAGKVVSVLSMVQDITERRRAEDAMRMQLEQISAIFDSINAVVYVADLEHYELLYLNSQGEKVFGADWAGRKCYQFLQDDQNKVCSFCTNEHLVKDGVPQEPYIWEFRNTLNGHWYRCIDRAIPWPDGRLVRVEIAFDITDNKQMEQLKDEMISAVSHEMRTPLTAILGYAEFLLDNDPDPEARKTFTRTIFDEADKLNQMIDAFLNLQRHKAKQQPPTLVALSVGTLLTDVAEYYRDTTSLHQLRIDCPDELPAIRGDEEQLRQLLGHLVSNALKFSPDGGVVTVGARRRGDLIDLWVDDQGVGIPAPLLKKVFERFYRVDNSDRRVFGGVGLGLTLVREIVETHSGEVWIESEEGRGTTVHVTLNVSC